MNESTRLSIRGYHNALIFSTTAHLCMEVILVRLATSYVTNLTFSRHMSLSKMRKAKEFQ
jgi:hypothetical protein